MGEKNTGSLRSINDHHITIRIAGVVGCYAMPGIRMAIAAAGNAVINGVLAIIGAIIGGILHIGYGGW